VASHLQSRRRVIRIAGVFFALAGILWSTALNAADKFWQVDGGDYNVDANWNPAGVPNNDDPFITDGKSANLATTPPPAHQFYVGATFDHGGTSVGTGIFNQTGGDLHLAGAQSWMVIADKPGDASTYNLSGGSLVLDDDFVTVGQHGTGFLNVSGNATMNVRGMNLGRWGDPGTGTGTLKDTAIITTRENGFNLGNQGIGTFTQEGGTLNVGAEGSAGGYGSWAFIGGHDESTGPRTGTYNMKGGTFNARERIQISQGAGSTGTFNQTGGDVIAGTRNTDGSAGPEGFIEIGQGGVGTYNLSAGTVTAVRSLVVGSWQGGDGRFNINGGTVNIGEAFQVARGSTDPANRGDPVAGLVDHKSGVVNTFWTEIGTSRFLGQTFVGTYKLSGDGVLNIQYEMNIGRNNGEGVFEMSGGTVNVGLNATGQKTFNIGRGGKGTFSMSGGTINLPEGFMLSSIEGNILGQGTGTQTGGTINTNWVSIGQHGAATYTMSGGLIKATGDFNVGDVTGIAPYVSTFNLSDTALVQSNAAYVGKNTGTGGIVNQTGGTFQVGAGGMVIARDAGSTGTYNLKGGILDGISNNTLRFGAGTAAFNMTGGELRNFGNVNFPLNNQGGRVVIGDHGGAPGTLSVMGNYSQNAASALELDILGQGQFETMTVNGDVSLAGNLTINRDPSYEPPIGTTFDIIFGNSVNGHFDTLTNNQAGPVFRFAPRYLPSSVQLVVAIPGDADLNQTVNFVDFQILERNFGLPGRTWNEADFNGDGTVSFADFQFLFQNFGQSFPVAATPPSAAEMAAIEGFYATHVPEPIAGGIVSLGALYLLGRRRPR
jgi:hypothetical protein